MRQEPECYLTIEQAQILGALKTGACNAVSTQFLCSLTGLSMRKLRKEIRDLRLNGFIICSAKAKPYGYYKPGSRAEAAEFAAMFGREGRAIYQAAAHAKKYGQQG